MKRRTVLIGLGSAAAGSAVVFGSGAFTQVSADRGVTIGIDRDSEALLALIANDDFDSIEEVDGELTIDSEKLSEEAKGFNVGATIEIGETDDDEVVDGEEAFKIVNNFDSNVNVTIDLTDEDFDDGSGELTFHTTRTDNELSESVTADEEDGELTLEAVESGAEVRVALEIETDSTDEPEDLEGEVTFSADPSAQEAPPGEPGSVQLNGEPKDSLDDAVGDAEDGDTITLGPSNSSYELTRALDVPNLTIEGPNVGVPGDGDRGSEAKIDGQIEVDASDVTLSGVAVGPVTDDPTIITNEPADRFKIVDSIVESDGGERAIQQPGGDNVEELTVDSSLFERPADSGGDAGALNLNNGVGDTITDSTFDGFGNAVRMENEDNADGITIEGNHITNHATGVVVRGENHEIRNNVFEDPAAGNEVGITVSSGNFVNNVEIEDNEFRENQFGLFLGDDSDNVTIKDNEFEDNDTHLLDEDGVVDVADVLEDNEFDAAASVDDLDPDGDLSGNTGAILPEIQGAVDEAAEDATVTVAPGTYEEEVEIGVEDLKLESLDGPEETTIEGDVFIGTEGGGASNPTSADGTVVDGFEIVEPGLDGDGQGIGVTESADVVIQNNEFEGFRTQISLDFSGDDVEDITIQDNTFSDVNEDSGTAIGATENVDGLDILDNEFVNNRNDIGTADSTENVTIEDNEFEAGDSESYISVRAEGLDAEEVRDENDFDPEADIIEIDDGDNEALVPSDD